MTIYFYGAQSETYGCFSNFSLHGFELDGEYYPTSEHYFQAMKFIGSSQDMAAVQRAATPHRAAQIGRDRKRPLRPDWEAVKDDVMRRAVLQKFQVHTEIRTVLLGTGDEELVENAPRDYYWGIGSKGTGKNMLGKILMETRTLLRAEAEL
ncbi:MAG: NADAR family protein [Armatimonadetes bacterium]|nr:NADAR family protein [Anaerolineae bacterium]